MIDTPAIEKLLGELEALHEKATPGPWQHQKPMDVPEDNGIAIIGLRLDENGFPLFTPTNGLVAIACQSPAEIDAGDFTRALANASLVQGAVNNLPTLITTIRALMEAAEDGRRELSRATGRQRISIVDQHGSEVGHRHASMKELLTEEAFVDEDGTAWTIPTAWAYRQACLAIRSKGGELYT